jgi:uncharacterized protein (DUF58 family)
MMPRRDQRSELTLRGWSLCGTALGLVIVSRLLGLVELLVVGVVGLTLAGASLLWVRSRRLDLELARSLGSARLHVGGDGRVDLTVTNRGRAATPVLALDERFGDGRRAARFLLPALNPGARGRAAYRIPTARRGHYAVGPLVAVLTDPFGFARRAFEVGPVDQVTVYPRLHDVAAPPLGGGGRRATTDAIRARAISLDGDEFTALREYEVGDDLRKVHWPATARTGELFIRQDVAYREPQVVVLLDTRADVYDGPSFEVAVEAVASILVRLIRDGRRLAVRTTSGTELCRAEDPAVGLDRLSVLEPSVEERGLDAAAAVSGGALLVVVTGSPPVAELRALATDRRRSVILVTTGALATAGGPASPSLAHVDASSGTFAAAWNRAVLTAGPERPAWTGASRP